MPRAGAIKNGGLVVAEMPKTDKLILTNGFKFVEERRYGISSIYLFNWMSD